jgi:helix-turn-helix protein
MLKWMYKCIRGASPVVPSRGYMMANPTLSGRKGLAMPVLPTVEAPRVPGYLTLPEAASRANRDKETIRRWIRLGRIQGARLSANQNGQLLVPAAALAALLDER